MERLRVLKRFLTPKVADLILAGGAEDPLKSHRQEVTVAFVDLRGFTAFTETTVPEEVMAVLHDYHAEAGRLIVKFEGTLERFLGDGIMIVFNDPLPVPDHELQAVRMAVAMRSVFAELGATWRKKGHDLNYGIGIAQGYATIGEIGFEGRRDYSTIGPVCNLAARLCSEAKGGQILVPQRVLAKLEQQVQAETVGDLSLKGIQRPVTAYNILGLRE
jgi:class 3 adenylate cyclase